MISSIIWPAELGVEIDAIGIDENGLIVVAHGTQTTGRCPRCGAVSHRINGYYRRHPADLPCSGPVSSYTELERCLEAYVWRVAIKATRGRPPGSQGDADG